MASLRLILGNDPLALLEAAADGFLAPARSTAAFPSPDYLLALRQGGLRDDLLRLAAERGVPGWFDPPLCLFQQLHEWLGGTERKPCGDYERVVLIGRLLREAAPAVFGRLARPDAFVDAVDRLFGELMAEGVEPDAFDEALAARADRDDFEAARDRDLSLCFRTYAAALAAAGRRDGRDGLLDCAVSVRTDPIGLEARLGDRVEVRIFGLQDLRGGWPVLIRALRESPALERVAIYSAASADIFEALHPDIVERMDAAHGLADRIFGAGAEAGPFAGPGSGSVEVAIVSAPDADREVEDVGRRVRELIDGGVEPSRIAVLARSARPYVDRVVDALSKYGVPATARRRHAFAEIPVVRALLSLFSVAAGGWTRHGLVELAEQPYFGRFSRGAAQTPFRRLDPVILNHIGYRRRVEGLDAWIRAHDDLRQRAEVLEARIAAGEEERWGRDAPPPSSRVAEAATFFRRFADQARELERPRPLREWVDWLRDFLESDPWKIELHVFKVPEDRYDVARLDAAGLGGIRAIVRQWHDALEAWGEADDAAIGVAAFETHLRAMLSGAAALWTFTRRAVLVSEALAAAQRTFDHVFIVGLAGDGFPRRAPRSPVLDEHDRVALKEAGLPLDVRDTWDRRERELFRVLVAGAARSLTLCFPRADERGRELVPSAFLEETALALFGEETSPLTLEFLKGSDVAAASLPLVTDADAIRFARHAADIELDRRTGRLSPYNGLIEEPALRAWIAERLGEDYVWSPTQLESYAKCPWSWFSQRLLRLEHLDDPDIDIDPIARGSILHDAMRRFYRLAQTKLRGPAFLRAADRAWIPRYLEQVLGEAVAAAGPGAWLGLPSLRRTRQEELLRMLLRYVDWEVEHNEKMHNTRSPSAGILRTGVVEHELSFGMPASEGSADVAEIERAAVRFRLRGSVDRVERGIDERLPHDERERYIAAVDYKTSQYSAPGGGKSAAWADGVVLQVPLYAHVLQQLRPGARVARVEYRAFKQTGVQHSLELYRIEKKTGLTKVAAAIEKMERALDDAGRHVARARAAEFPAHPAPSCACPPFCHALDVCRVAMGPRSGRAVDSEWKRMAAQIRGGRPAEGGGDAEEEGA